MKRRWKWFIAQRSPRASRALRHDVVRHRGDLPRAVTMQHERLAKAVSMTDFLMLHFLAMHKSMLKNLSKMVSARSAETINTYAPVACPDGILSYKQNTLLPVTDESKLAMTVMRLMTTPLT